MKKLRRLLVLIVVVLILVVVGALLMMDSLAKKAVETGGTYALGVETTVDSMSIRLVRGQLKMNGLRVANPEGFESPHLMESGILLVELKPASIFTDTMQLPVLSLDGLDMNIEQTLAGSNVSKILDNLKGLKKKEQQEKPKKPKKPGKKVRVDKVIIKNVVVHFVLIGGKGVTVKIPEIELNDVGSGDGGDQSVADLIAQIFPAILEAVVKNSKGIVSDEFLKDIGGNLDELTAVAAERLKDLSGQADKAATDAVEGAKKKLDELFGGGSDKE